MTLTGISNYDSGNDGSRRHISDAHWRTCINDVECPARALCVRPFGWVCLIFDVAACLPSIALTRGRCVGREMSTNRRLQPELNVAIIINMAARLAYVCGQRNRTCRTERKRRACCFEGKRHYVKRCVTFIRLLDDSIWQFAHML